MERQKVFSGYFQLSCKYFDNKRFGEAPGEIPIFGGSVQGWLKLNLQGNSSSQRDALKLARVIKD